MGEWIWGCKFCTGGQPCKSALTTSAAPSMCSPCGSSGGDVDGYCPQASMPSLPVVPYRTAVLAPFAAGVQLVPLVGSLGPNLPVPPGVSSVNEQMRDAVVHGGAGLRVVGSGWPALSTCPAPGPGLHFPLVMRPLLPCVPLAWSTEKPLRSPPLCPTLPSPPMALCCPLWVGGLSWAHSAAAPARLHTALLLTAAWASSWKAVFGRQGWTHLVQ